MKLRRELIPESLRDLIPIVERWGLAADTARHAAGTGLTQREKAEIATALQGRHREIERWLFSENRADPPDAGRAAFTALLVFEMEECEGPGIRGWLDFAVLEALEDPSLDNIARLRAAYEYTRSAANEVGSETQWSRELQAAKMLLASIA